MPQSIKLPALQGKNIVLLQQNHLHRSCCVQLFLALKFAQSKGVDIYDYTLDLKTIPSYIEKAYELSPKIKQLARFISKYKNIVITADGSSYALAKKLH